MENRMTDSLCVIMGIVDIIARILIIVCFSSSGIGVVFRVGMIIKGGISFI